MVRLPQFLAPSYPSRFPLSPVLTVYCLHQRYLNRTTGGVTESGAACFILRCVAVQHGGARKYPDIGSNFFPAVLSVALVFWIGSRMPQPQSQLPERNYFVGAGKRSATCQKHRMAPRLSGLQITVR